MIRSGSNAGPRGSAFESVTGAGLVTPKFSDERPNLVRAVESAPVTEDRHVVVGWLWQITHGGPESLRMHDDLSHRVIVRPA